MPAKTTTPTRKPAPRRRKPVPRARVGKGLKVPKSVPLAARVGMWFALQAAAQMDAHKSTVMSRKDAAILRMTHEGCPTCKGNGQIFTKGKDGSFTGSKPCPAKPTKAKAGRMKVAMAARFSPDKRTGLIGWTCPCGSKTKPKFRDAKEATAALKSHNQKRHGGKSVGGAWYGQAPEGAVQEEETKAVTPKTRQSRSKAPASKPPIDPNAKNPHSGLTDKEWLAQGTDRVLEPGECNHCQGTTYIAVINPSAESDYDRQVFRRCTNCVQGRIRT